MKLPWDDMIKPNDTSDEDWKKFLEVFEKLYNQHTPCDPSATGPTGPPITPQETKECGDCGRTKYVDELTKCDRCKMLLCHACNHFCTKCSKYYCLEHMSEKMVSTCRQCSILKVDK